MKRHLTPEEKSAILPKIEAVMNGGDKWEAPELHLPASAFIEAILELPGVSKGPDTDDANEGFSQNGWQFDWWQEFIRDGKSYTLSGCGYYGGHEFFRSDN